MLLDKGVSATVTLVCRYRHHYCCYVTRVLLLPNHRAGTHAAVIMYVTTNAVIYATSSTIGTLPCGSSMIVTHTMAVTVAIALTMNMLLLSHAEVLVPKHVRLCDRRCYYTIHTKMLSLLAVIDIFASMLDAGVT